MPDTAVCIAPAMASSGDPAWADAVWIGALDLDRLHPDLEYVTLAGASSYSRCRLLVRTGATTTGFVDLPVVDSRIRADDVRVAARQFPRRVPFSPPVTGDTSVTVTVSTRNRPDHLRELLPSLLALAYDDLEIVVVDNASDGDSTRDIVGSVVDPRVRYVREPRVGLSRGRNRGLLEARGTLVAFTDDDVVVDPHWVDRLVSAFESAPDIGVVTGMVPTGELRAPEQHYFETQTGWQRSCAPETYRRTDVRPDIPLFPLDVGRYGTGANFAVRRDLAIRLGGFNEALGIGSPAQGGEDLDMFLRVLYGGWALAYTPDALVWHRHRSDSSALETAVRGYATSWSAWMASLIENPDIRRDAVRLGVGHVSRRVRQLSVGAVRHDRLAGVLPGPRTDLGLPVAYLATVERKSLVGGPAAYMRSRRGGRRTRPLLGVRGVG